jgi:ABC-type Na+ efflux pump permease subunit
MVSALRGSIIVMRRELRALLVDKQAIYVTLVFGLVFPFLISRDPVKRPGGIVALILQVSLFPFFAGFQAAIVSFAGEKEKGTLGPILATPLPNAAIFGGKLLGAFVPGLLTAAVSISIMLATLPAAGRRFLEQLPSRFVIEAIALSTVTGLVLVVIGTLVGSRAKTLRGAQLFAGVIIAPVFIGMLTLGSTVFENELLGWVVLAGLAILCVPLTWAGARVWRREEVLTKT